MMTEYIINKIREADLVLVGIGEELDALKIIRMQLADPDLVSENKIKSEVQSAFEAWKQSWIFPYIQSEMIKAYAYEKKEIYDQLAASLYGKNYFIVSLCQDGLIRDSSLDQEKIVEPCGGYRRLQCSGACHKELYERPRELLEQAEEIVSGIRKEITCQEPFCPHCGKPLVFNNVEADQYVEEGYLDRWTVYKKWLQGTVNRRVCLLEIGVGMKYPTVIRWPFEKIVYYNQKAELFRVHSRLYQISEQIRERGYGICRKPEEFLKELSQDI